MRHMLPVSEVIVAVAVFSGFHVAVFLCIFVELNERLGCIYDYYVVDFIAEKVIGEPPYYKRSCRAGEGNNEANGHEESRR